MVFFFIVSLCWKCLHVDFKFQEFDFRVGSTCTDFEVDLAPLKRDTSTYVRTYEAVSATPELVKESSEN
jgi:hypothetical protein